MDSANILVKAFGAVDSSETNYKLPTVRCLPILCLHCPKSASDTFPQPNKYCTVWKRERTNTLNFINSAAESAYIYINMSFSLVHINTN